MEKTEENAPVILTEDELKKLASKELKPVVRLETKISELEMALSNNPQFKDFMALKKAVADKSSEVMKKIEKQMIDSNIKSITLEDWGKLTIVDGKTWTYDETQLPRKFLVKKVDTTAITAEYNLKGVAPKGASFVPNQYIKATPKKEKKAK